MTVLNLPDPPRRPGRPPKPEPVPLPSAREAEARRLEVLDELVSADDLVVADRVGDPHLIDQAVRELAVECAQLGWLVRRARARRTAKATQLAGQRIRALSRVAGLVLMRARSGIHPTEEPPAELLERLQDLFLAEVADIANDTLGEALSAKLLAKVRAKLDGGAGVEDEDDLDVQGRIPVDSDEVPT